MNRKRYEEYNREYRQIYAAYERLIDHNPYIRDANREARQLLLIGLNKFYENGTAGAKGFDRLKYRRLDRNENRMTGYPTPKLKGI